MDNVVENYENNREEDRLTTNNARRIEFITTVKALEDILPPKARILDCAAGTGVYAFHFADRGHDITALDLTPRHIEVIEKQLESRSYSMNTSVNDATDLSKFDDESFDVVLCMGPIYHLTDKSKRDKCISECIRVLKSGGVLAVAYINRFYIFPFLTMNNSRFLNAELARKLVETGTITHDDPNCFWTDSYYAIPEELEYEFEKKNLVIIDHLATDGLSPSFLRDKIDSMGEDEYKVWCDYHYSVCREKSILGASNHGLIVGRK